MNIRKFGVAVLVAGSVSLPAAADDTYYDTARVISATPHTERINAPRQECHTEYQRGYSYGPSSNRSPAGVIIGGIAGGVIGNHLGRGSGRGVATAIGAVTGAIVGDRIDNDYPRNQYYSERPVERCTVVGNWQTVTRGYEVTYRYNGRDYTTILPYDPGSSVNVRVSVTPEQGGSVSYLEPAYRNDYGRQRGWSRRYRDFDERYD